MSVNKVIVESLKERGISNAFDDIFYFIIKPKVRCVSPGFLFCFELIDMPILQMERLTTVDEYTKRMQFL